VFHYFFKQGSATQSSCSPCECFVEQAFFRLTALTATGWLWVVALSLSPVVATEVIKIFLRAFGKKTNHK
jgi:hypothetical protein